MALTFWKYLKRKQKIMSFKISQTKLPEVLVVEPEVFGDSRGFFLETYHYKKYAEKGIEKPFVQDNHSRSSRGILRGLHYQLKTPQAKLVYAATGEILDVAVDIRKGSPAFGEWVGIILSEENHFQLYVPEGFAHGFCVLSETADVIYKCSDLYTPGDDMGVNWSDKSININWPEKVPLLSDKDKNLPLLKDISDDLLPPYIKV
jgi:dTDP-4-dehydrorhamnose 3,5-epimerase